MFNQILTNKKIIFNIFSVGIENLVDINVKGLKFGCMSCTCISFL